MGAIIVSCSEACSEVHLNVGNGLVPDRSLLKFPGAFIQQRNHNTAHNQTRETICRTYKQDCDGLAELLPLLSVRKNPCVLSDLGKNFNGLALAT